MQQMPLQRNALQRQQSLLRFQQGVLALENRSYGCFDSAPFVADLSGYIITLHRRGHLDVLRRLLLSLADCCVCSSPARRQRAILVVAVYGQVAFPWRDRKVLPVLVEVFARWLDGENVWFAGIPFVCRQIQSLLTYLDGQDLSHQAAPLAAKLVAIQGGELVKAPKIRQAVNDIRSTLFNAAPKDQTAEGAPDR